MKKVGFFEEKEGVKSSMRLFSFIVLVTFVAINLMYFAACQNSSIDYSFIAFDFMLLIGVFAPKYLQKLAEMKNNG